MSEGGSVAEAAQQNNITENVSNEENSSNRRHHG